MSTSRGWLVGGFRKRAHRAEDEGAHRLNTEEQLAAKAAARKAKKTRQRERRAKEAERAASEAERAEAPRAQLRENIQCVMAGLRTAAAQTRSQAGSKIGVEYSRCPRRGTTGINARPQQGVRQGSPGDRGDDGRLGLARKRAGRVGRD